MRKVLITAGGTIEKIDDVRSIKNEASGKLGSLIANEFFEAGYEITYVHGQNAVVPKVECELHEIVGVRDLKITIENLLLKNDYEVVVHSMAISDFYIDSIVQNEASLPVGTGKISSESPLQIDLKPAPKIIRLFKELSQPFLIGFKLLAGSTDEELTFAVNKQIASAQSDWVLANHKEEVSKGKHKARLYNHDGVLGHYETKEAIAKGIMKLYLERVCEHNE